MHRPPLYCHFTEVPEFLYELRSRSTVEGCLRLTHVHTRNASAKPPASELRFLACTFIRDGVIYSLDLFTGPYEPTYAAPFNADTEAAAVIHERTIRDAAAQMDVEVRPGMLSFEPRVPSFKR
jgi:hypothetical protein